MTLAAVLVLLGKPEVDQLDVGLAELAARYTGRQTVGQPAGKQRGVFLAYPPRTARSASPASLPCSLLSVYSLLTTHYALLRTPRACLSPSFSAALEVNRMFSGFRSRCTMFRLCKYCKACSSWRMMQRASGSLHGPLSTR